jgi:hypothetical protein
MREARIWYSRDLNQSLLAGGFENVIVLSDEFYHEVTAHSIPTDLEAAKALSSAPAALDLYMWLSYRCFTAKGQERIPIFGEFGLVAQLGSLEYARPRKFRERLEGRLDLIRCLWRRAAQPGLVEMTICWFSLLWRWRQRGRRWQSLRWHQLPVVGSRSP